MSSFLLHLIQRIKCIFLANGSHVKSRIHKIDVLLVKFFPQQLHGFTKTLEMNNFPLPQELYYIVYIGIVTQTQNVIVGYSCFLLWHGKIIATKYILKFGNKRLISAILSSNSSYISVLLLRRQASISPKYRKRLTQHSLRKQLAQHQKSQCRIGHRIAIYENLYMIITN